MKPVFISIILFFGIQFHVFCQLDSVQVELDFTTHPGIPVSDSLGDLKVKIEVNNLAYFGRISVDLYNNADNSYIKSIVLTKEEIVTGGFSFGNGFTLIFELLGVNAAYKVEATLQDQDLFYITPIITIYNP